MPQSARSARAPSTSLSMRSLLRSRSCSRGGGGVSWWCTQVARCACAALTSLGVDVTQASNWDRGDCQMWPRAAAASLLELPHETASTARPTGTSPAGAARRGTPRRSAGSREGRAPRCASPCGRQSRSRAGTGLAAGCNLWRGGRRRAEGGMVAGFVCVGCVCVCGGGGGGGGGGRAAGSGRYAAVVGEQGQQAERASHPPTQLVPNYPDQRRSSSTGACRGCAKAHCNAPLNHVLTRAAAGGEHGACRGAAVQRPPALCHRQHGLVRVPPDGVVVLRGATGCRRPEH